MCGIMVFNLISEVLSEKIANGDIFTAYDVTVAVRDKTNDTVPHNDVRNVLNQDFVTGQMDNYNRELCTLNTHGNPQALVYYPDGSSPSDHPLVDDTVVVDDEDDSSTSFVDHSSTSTAVDLGDDEYATTKEGRIQIPRKITNQVTPDGGTYDILIKGNLKNARKDARGDLRIGLKQFGINDSKVKITVDTDNNVINIETV